MTLTLTAAILVGVTLGLLGGGGSILTVPILVYLADVPTKEAIAMSLFVVGVTAVFAVIAHARAGRIRWRTGVLFGLAGMIGGYAGGRVAEYVPDQWLLAGFALMMVAAAVAMLRGRRTRADRPVPHELPVAHVLADGVVVGVATGLVGAGGGFIVVPALVLLGGLPMTTAVGTSLLVIAMNSAAGLAGHLHSVHIQWGLALAVTAAAVTGSVLGGRLAGKISQDVLRRAFGWFVLAMAAFVLLQQAPAAARHWLLATPTGWATLAAAVLGAVLAGVRQHRQSRSHSARRPSATTRHTGGRGLSRNAAKATPLTGTARRKPLTTPSAASHHEVLIIGGGTAGITVAARLRRAGVVDVAIVEPSDQHYYQPLWTLVGGGRAPAGTAVRPEAGLIPKGVSWIRGRAVDVDPDARTVRTQDGQLIGYDFLVVAPGLQLDFDRVPGLAETLGRNHVSSNYRVDLAPRTWDYIRDTTSGTALFTMPPGPIKCAGAPQKIAYLAADWWRRQGRLDDIRVILVLPTAAMFSQPDWAEVLVGVAAGYGMEVRRESQLVEVSGDRREAVILDTTTGTKQTLDYAMLHAVPPQSAPDWVKRTPLADAASPFGYVQVDQYTLQSPNWPSVFALGDVANLPTSKTGAAIRKQAPVVVANLLAARAGQRPAARYDGYTSCPLVTAHNRVLLAEFDYQLTPTPSFPLINTMKPRYDMWLLKRYGLPALYWYGMLCGRA